MKIGIIRRNVQTRQESYNNLSIEKLIEKIKSPTTNDRKYIEGLRKVIPFMQGRRVHYEHIDRLPCICPAIEYSEKAKYNGVIQLEIDQLSNQSEIDEIKAQARLLPQTWVAFTGASGKSVKIWVRFSLPDGKLPQEKVACESFHAQAYRVAVACYQALLPYPVTLKPAQPNTVCRLSMDERAYFNPQAIPFCIEQPYTDCEHSFRENRRKESNPLARLEPGFDTQIQMRRLYENALEQAMDALGEWKRGDKLQALLVQLAEQCFRRGIPEEETVRQSLIHYPKEDETALRSLVHNLYRECKGIKQGKSLNPEQNLILRMEEFMERRFECRLNTVTGAIEYRRKDSIHFQFRPADKRARNSIAMDALEEGLRVWDRDVDRYLSSDRIPVYNPVEDYLHSAEEWDGKDRIGELADCVPCENQAQWRKFFYRWFLNMVAHWRGMDNLHGNCTVPLLIGAQGFRKSTFCRLILPPELRFAYSENLDLRSSRDAELALSRFLLINLDEFDQIGNSKQGYLKHLLQKPTVNLRKPYATAVEEMKRYASFIATSNHTDLLNDPSGNRRFICIEVTAPIQTEKAINYRQLYAQAIHALNYGERYWFDKTDEALLTRENERFEKINPIEVALQSTFRPTVNDKEGEELNLIQIAEILNRTSRTLHIKLTTGEICRLGRLMKKYGFKCRHTNRGMLYRVVSTNL